MEFYPWMCELCFEGCMEIGIIAPGYSLILKPDGVYYILGGGGHMDDELVRFPTKPFPDPDPECEIDDCPESDRWLDEVRQFEAEIKKTGLTFSEAHQFYDAGVEAGYARECGHFEYWVFGRAGELIEIYEGRKPKPRAEGERHHWNYRVMRHRTPLPEKFQAIEGHPYEVWFGIHELHYENDEAVGWTQDPVPLLGSNVEELKFALRHMLLACGEGVLDYDEKPPEVSG